MKDYYQTLGLSPSCSYAEIKSEYRKLVVKFHPNEIPGDGRFEERYKELHEAYQVLSRPDRRKSYDLRTAVADKSDALPATKSTN